MNGISNSTFQYFYNWYHTIIICVVDVKRSAPTACSSAKRQCGGVQPDPQPAGCSHWPSPAPSTPPPASPSTPSALPTTPQRYCNWCGRATTGTALDVPPPVASVGLVTVRCPTASLQPAGACATPAPTSERTRVNASVTSSPRTTMMSPKPPTSRWPFTTTGRR